MGADHVPSLDPGQSSGGFAERMRQPALSKSGKPKRESGKSQESPTGSPWAPGAYMVGLALLLAGSTIAVLYGAVHPIRRASCRGPVLLGQAVLLEVAAETRR